MLRKNLWEFLVAPSAQFFLKKKFNELDLKNCEQFRFSINSLQLRNHLIVLIFLWKHFLGKINSTAHSLTHISLLYLFLSAILFSSCSSKSQQFLFIAMRWNWKLYLEERTRVRREKQYTHCLAEKRNIKIKSLW